MRDPKTHRKMAMGVVITVVVELEVNKELVATPFEICLDREEPQYQSPLT
jgi:hypothetical protein